MRKLSKEQMIEKIENGYYYITKEYDFNEDREAYFLTHDYGSKHTQVKITDERANEWLDLGAELLEL